MGPQAPHRDGLNTCKYWPAIPQQIDDASKNKKKEGKKKRRNLTGPKENILFSGRIRSKLGRIDISLTGRLPSAADDEQEMSNAIVHKWR